MAAIGSTPHVVEAAPGHGQEVRRLVFDRLSPEHIPALADIASTIGAALGAPTPADIAALRHPTS